MVDGGLCAGAIAEDNNDLWVGRLDLDDAEDVVLMLLVFAFVFVGVTGWFVDGL